MNAGAAAQEAQVVQLLRGRVREPWVELERSFDLAAIGEDEADHVVGEAHFGGDGPTVRGRCSSAATAMARPCCKRLPAGVFRPILMGAMEFVAQMLRLIESLNAHGVQYILVGGGALNVHGLVRATEDLDLCVAQTDANIERLKEALAAVWDDPDIQQISGSDLCGDYPAVRYGPPDGVFFIDILTRLGEAFRYEDLDWETVELSGVPARVATPQTLYRLKKGTVRHIDRADAHALKRFFDVEEE